MWKTPNAHSSSTALPLQWLLFRKRYPSYFVQERQGGGIVTIRPMELVHDAHPAQWGLSIHQGSHTGISASLHAQKVLSN